MIIHKGLQERWYQFSLAEQLANVGTDVGRAVRWKEKDDLDSSQKAFERALELLDFTLADPKNKKSLRELCRVREALVDFFVYDNEYQSTAESWQKYFYYFGYLAALAKGK